VRGRLDDHDLAVLGGLAPGQAEARREVVDRDDLAPEADDAANPAGLRRYRARLGVADDLVHLADRQGVLLAAEREDDELAGAGFGGHGSSGKAERCPHVIDPAGPLLSAHRSFRRTANTRAADAGPAREPRRYSERPSGGSATGPEAAAGVGEMSPEIS